MKASSSQDAWQRMAAGPLEHGESVSQWQCANCDIEIAWEPTIVGGLPYCCPGCAAGGPCTCEYA